MTATTYHFCGKGRSIKEPWASAIAYAGKDIENRSLRTHYRGPITIHASSPVRQADRDPPVRIVRGGEKKPLSHWLKLGIKKYWTDFEEQLIAPGHIVAIAMLVDCVNRSSSPWFDGKWGWVLEGIIPIDPVEWKGARSIWDCECDYQTLSKL